MECTLLHRGIAFRVSFDDHVLSAELIDGLLHDIANITQTLPMALDEPVLDYLFTLIV